MKEPSISPFASESARLRRRIRQRKRPVQARAQATTDALVDATLQVLVREGYQRLTTTRVAERAGVSVGTLYQYFPDKRSLVTALKVRYFGLMLDAVGHAVSSAAHGPLEHVLRASLAALIDVKRSHLDLTKALREPMVELGGQALVHETLSHFAALLAPFLLERGASDSEAGRRSTLLVAAIEGAISYAVFEEPRWLDEPWLVDELFALAAGYFGVRGAV
jgi:AcrR family transcriptional regulator